MFSLLVFTEGLIRCCQDLHLLNGVRRNGVKFHFSWPETTCFHQMFKPAPISLLAPASLVVLTSFSPSLSNKSLFYLCCSRALIHPMCSARSILTDGDRCNGIGWFWSLITGLDPLQEVKWKRSLSTPTGYQVIYVFAVGLSFWRDKQESKSERETVCLPVLSSSHNWLLCLLI